MLLAKYASMKSKDFSTSHKNNHDNYQRGYCTVQFRLVLLCSIILSFSIIPMAKTCSADAVGTVYIRADGSIEGTTYIQTVDNITYVFTVNINDSIVVERNNIIIEGNGHTLQGAGSGIGIDLPEGTNMTVHNATIKAFQCGILLNYSSSSNVLSGNNITNNSNGIALASSSNNTVSGNNITTNDVGIVLDYSSNNVIYHNNFVDNHEQVSSNTSMNVWDDGYPFGGNYWSDYNGTDANHDGIGDTPYVIDANNTDHYPLMVQYVIPEFPSFLVLPLFMVATLLAIVIYKRRHLTRA